MAKYIKDCTRMMSDDDVAIWRKGEWYLWDKYGIELHSKFERDGENVEISYEKQEGNKAHEAIKHFLKNEENFDDLCDDFIEAIRLKHEAQAKMMPALIIFDEMDRYPEIICFDDDKIRLMRIRTSTHEESYK